MINENKYNDIDGFIDSRTATDKSVIERRSDELAKETENLFTLVNQLRDRLKPILSPHITEQIGSLADNPNVPTGSPISGYFTTQREQVLNIREVVGDIMQRLEI
jgi:hypothetical protein